MSWRYVRARAARRWARAAGRVVLCAAATIGLKTGGAAGGDGLRLLMEQNPPHNYRDAETGTLKGRAVRVVQALMTGADITHTITVLPWRRAWQQTLDTPNTCLFSMNRTPDREDLFQWVGPLITGKWQFFSRADDPITLDRVEDAHGHVVVGLDGSANLKAYRKSGGQRIIPVPEDAHGARLLMHGRADLWLTGKQDAAHVLDADPDISVHLALTFRDVRLDMGCHPATEPALLAAMRARLPDARAEAAS